MYSKSSTANTVYNLFWDKTGRIKRNTLINDVHYGGLLNIDTESKKKSIKSLWFPKLTNKNKGFLFNIFYIVL